MAYSFWRFSLWLHKSIDSESISELPLVDSKQWEQGKDKRQDNPNSPSDLLPSTKAPQTLANSATNIQNTSLCVCVGGY